MSQTIPHQALYRRWRAQTFAQVVGQEPVVETLRNAVRTGRVAHAILFVGPRGTGKTSLARILAKAVNCTNLQDGDPCDACPSCVAIREGRALDLVEIDAASNRGIDAIRELRERINYAPTDLRRKVYILDEAHQITKDAWNALLKSLEEPPDFVIFMFASTHPQDFPPAILSRLQRFDVRRLTTAEIEGKLVRILAADGREADPAAIGLIARLAGGGMRDAESMLDQLLSSSAGSLDESQVRELLGLAEADVVDGFLAALVAGDVVAGFRILDSLEERGRDLRSFLDQVIESVRTGLVSASTEAATATQPLATLAAVARRLAAIDPNRPGIGGLRLQLELALFPAEASSGATVGVAPPAGSRAAIRRAPEAFTAPVRSSAPVASVGPSPDPSPAATSELVADRAAAAPPPGAADSGAAEAHASPAGEAATRRRARPEPPPPVAPAPEASPSGPPSGVVNPADREAPEAAFTPPPVAGDLATLRDRWPEVVARVSAHPPTKPLILACRPISVEDGIVTLGFPEDQGFLRTVAERRRAVLEEGIAAVLGRQYGVRCVATNLDLVPPAPAETDAAFVLSEARRIFGDDVADPAEIT